MIHFTCACGKGLKVPDDAAGKKTRCPACGSIAVVPVSVAAGTRDDATAAVSSPDAGASAADCPTDTGTRDLNATAALPPANAGQDNRADDRTAVTDAAGAVDAAAVPSAEGAGAGWTLGDYRILRELGHGGMALVYEAEDVRLERRVALKILKPEIARNPQHCERFLREACTAASVECDFICRIYEVGEDQGVPFIAMPFLIGNTLKAYWKQNQRLPIDEVVRIGKEVAEGLSVAHEAGLVHRDIKPANIWLETQPSGPPRAIILDFGLARVQEDNVQITQSGVIVGTPAYMSPEQARGERGVDARTDLFSLGCVLYGLCTGELPFKGKQMMDVLLALATHDPAPPHTIVPAIPQPLSDLIVRLLAKTPGDRPRTAREVIDKLVAIEADLPKPAQKTQSVRLKVPTGSASKSTRVSRTPDKTAIVTQEMVPGAAPPARRRKKSYALYTLLAVGLLSCLSTLVGGAYYYVVTGQGTIEIQTEDANVRISLLKDGREIDILDSASKKTWSVRAGTYTVRLKDDQAGMKIALPDTFELKRGETHVVTIRKLAGPEVAPVADADRQQIAALPPAVQVEEVRKELVKRNPGYDGTLIPELADNAVKGLTFRTDRLVDISPIRALTRLQSLSLDHCKLLQDLSPLKGMSLSQLDVSFSQIRDLTPLKGMPLSRLHLYACQVQDLEPLRDMPLTSLVITGCKAQNLEPLKGMKLTSMNIENTLVRDLTPLKGMPLAYLNLLNCRVSNLEPLKGMPLTSLDLRSVPVTDLLPLKDLPLTSLNLRGVNATDLLPLRDVRLKTLWGEFQAKRDARFLLPIKTLATINDMPAERFFKEFIFAPRLAPMLRGDDEPADDVERLAFAKYASDQKKYRFAVRLWTEALAHDPKLADDRKAQHRYHAARAALLAGSGQGEDQPPLYNVGKAKLRRQALDWLKAELTVWTRHFDAGAGRAEHVWIDDDIPPGAVPDLSWEASKAWTWVTRPQHPVLSGSRADMLEADGLKQHVFTEAPAGLRVGAGGSLFAYVYLDPARPPKEIMLQWHTGGWEHRAYWGDNLIDWGRDGSTERVRMGPLPEAGKWVRLEVDAARVGIGPAKVIRGWAFTQHGGTAYWDRAGSVTEGGPGSPQDVLAGLSGWQQDAALATARDAAALAKLPADERNEWQALWARVPQVRSVVPISKEEGQKWRYTTQKPPEDWQKADFDDKQWQEGVGGFGTLESTFGVARTEWKTDDIWLRREFTLPEGKSDDLLLLVNHDDGAEVHVNGALVFDAKGWSGGDYVVLPLSGAARTALHPGKNVFAVHCHNDFGAQHIDVGIVAVPDNPGRLLLAQIAYDRKQFALAAGLWAKVLASDPKLGDDRQTKYRYHAVRAAALAAAGQGEDAPQDDEAKASVRGQALDLLKAELAALSEKQPRLATVETLWHWQQDGDLAGIREPAELAKLPADEQKALALFWADVAKTEEPASDAERLEFAKVAGERLMDGDANHFAFYLAKLKACREQGLAILTGEIDRKSLPPAHSDWTVQFYKWNNDLTAAAWDTVLKSPILAELKMPRLHLVDLNDSPMPPTPKVPAEYFALVATTEVTLEGGEYVMKATSDDGVRVWLDNEVVLDDWSYHAPNTKSVTVRNKRGKHLIKIEFFQATRWYHLEVDFTLSKERLAQRQANAAVALLRLNQPDKVWPLLKHGRDPRVRSYLIHRLAPLGADAAAIVKHLDKESDLGILRAFLLSLGEFSEKDYPPEERKALVPKLQDMYRTAADPGLHAAAEWLLRQWKEESWLKETDLAWAQGKQQQLKRLEEITQELSKEHHHSPLTAHHSPRWYVNGQGHTLVVLSGPVEFWRGSPSTEEGRDWDPKRELRHWQRVSRSFAIASKEVTVEQFLRFRKGHPISREHAPSDDCPANMVSWYDAAAYCNWLSEQEGMPPDQWCYAPNAEGKYAAGMKMAPDYLHRTGYRLPTEAEWEYACRAGAATRYCFGESDELLPRYGWYQKNSQNRTWPAGSLKPNDLGLFDIHGNVWQWCQDEYKPYAQRADGNATEDLDDAAAIATGTYRVLRGGPFIDGPANQRSAVRGTTLPSEPRTYYGFRPVRTLPFNAFDRYPAARAAALGAAGQNKDKPPADDAAKVKLRRQALDWLKAELTNWSKVQPPRVFIARNLWQWQHDRDLAGIRDPEALAKLPVEEQKIFTQFWADVAKAAQPQGSGERLEFARAAVLIAVSEAKGEPFDDTAKAQLRDKALAWLKAELASATDRAGKAAIIAAAAPLKGALEELAESAPDDGQYQAELARHFAERGNMPLADAARSKARAMFEAKLAMEPANAALAADLADALLIDTRWTILKPAEMQSQGGATLTTLADNSILVSGPNRDKDVYTLTFRDLPARFQHLRLEVLPHESLPANGPGRPPDGNFVLTTIEAQLDSLTNKNGARRLKLARAFADFSQDSWSVAGAIDANDDTGWAIAPFMGRPHFAVFELAEALTQTDGSVLRVTLEFKSGIKQYLLGRFRLSASADPSAIDREAKRLAALKLTDPWAKLATAYALDGRNNKALESFGKAIERADGRAGKAAVIAAAAPLLGLVERLGESAPDDGQYQTELARHFVEHGNLPLAQAARSKACALFEGRLMKEPANAALAADLADAMLIDTRWSVLKPAEMKSQGGATLTLKADGSVLASGNNPDQDSYTVICPTSLEKIRAFRLEALPDPSLPYGRAGRATENGNFALSEWKVMAEPRNPGEAPRLIRWKDAWSDHRVEAAAHYENRPMHIGLAIDGDSQTFWESWPRGESPHWAIFRPEEPIGRAGGSKLIFTLEFRSRYIRQNLGRFRLAVSGDPAAFGAPALDREQKRLAAMKLTDPWAKLAAAYAVDGRHDKAAAYLGKALQADPKLADDRAAQRRYHAARAAVLAAAGQAKDQPPLDDAAKAKLRRQALDWLKAELTVWGKLFQSGPPQDRPTIVATLSAWQQDADLAGMRDPAALAKLPEEEQTEWQALWARVPAEWSLVPTSKEEGQKWRYTTQPPPRGWQNADFNDKQWQQGVGAFGSGREAVGTAWKTDDIWLRREFTMPDGKWDDVLLRINHDDDAEVYINGVVALKAPAWTTQYVEMPLSAQARAALQPGKNVIAVHCHNHLGPQYIDVGIVAVKNNAARVAVAQLAYDRKCFASATELWARALASDPQLGDDRQTEHRYHAARAAALAAAGQGVGEPPLDEAAKAKLRQQALEWLKAELAVWSDPRGTDLALHRSTAVQALGLWRKDSDLAGLRTPGVLAQLPAEEQKAFTQLWADVAALLVKNAEETLTQRPHDLAAADALAGVVLDKAEPNWSTLRPSAVKSEGGATLAVQLDDSVLASGVSPDKDVYVIETQFQGRIRAIRLEILPDPSMPAGGSGRSDTGNFVLTDFRVMVGKSPVAWSRASADFAQETDGPTKFLISNTIDADASTGWAVWPRTAEFHCAVFIPSQPITTDGKTPLTIRLAFQSGYSKHTLGRFRLSVTESHPSRLTGWVAAAATPHAKLGAAYVALGDAQRAVDLLTKATGANPKLPAADWLVLALAHARLKQTELALKACAKAAQLLKPSGAEDALRPLLHEVVISVGRDSPAAAMLIAAAAGAPPGALNEAIRYDHEDAAAHRDRGWWFAERGLWTEAVADWTELFRLDPDTLDGMKLGVLLVHTGQNDRYREHCQAMLDRWAETKKNFEADQTLKMLLLRPDVKLDAKQLARLAEVAVSGDKNVDWYDFWMFAKGLHDYRTAKYADALATCREIRLRAPQSKGDVQVLTSLSLIVEAMALYRSGDEAGARRVLVEAKAQVEVHVPGIDGGDWTVDWLFAQILYREAEKLIGAAKAEQSK